MTKSDRMPLCVFHGGCDDGMGAKLAVHMGLKGEVEFFYGAYDKPAPTDEQLKDRDVLFVDFSYKRPVIEHIMSLCRSLLVLDHHKSAQADLAFLPVALTTWEEHVKEPRFGAIFDMSRSGAMLAYDYFVRFEVWTGASASEQNRLANERFFFNYLQDRDLWLKKVQNGDEFTIALRSYPQTIEKWGQLRDAGPQMLIEEGFALQRYYCMRVEEMKKTTTMQKIDGWLVPTVNAPYFAASEVAGEIAQGWPFGACYFHNGVGWQFSLRSRGDFDVSDLAKKFGGGGHKAAAGFTCDVLPWESKQVEVSV